MEHPEYLFNEGSDTEYVLATAKIDTPEAALAWLRDFSGTDYEEIGVMPELVWLKPGPPPPEMEGYCEDGEWYGPCEFDDQNAAGYWQTEI